jgi:apolipoprotein D and lipocalin family protein
MAMPSASRDLRHKFTVSAHARAGLYRIRPGMLARIVRSGRLLVGAFAVAVALSSSGCGSSAPLDTAPSVDLSRMQGKWYEIARLPRTTQTDCHGTTAFYTQNADGTLTFVNECNVGGPTGPLNTVSMSASVPDAHTQSKLLLNVGGYTGDYWILEVGSNYEYAVVGHPSRLYFWILSRTPTLDDSTVKGILTRAQDAQFDTTKLSYTPQPPAGERATANAPVGDVPPTPKSGCSAAGDPARGDAAFAAGALAVAAIAAARRRRAA